MSITYRSSWRSYTGGEEVRAGLIGATHPATKRGAKYRCVRFGALIVCEPHRAFINT